MPVTPGKWKVLSSYLWPVHIESVHSEVNGKLDVLLYRGQWMLETHRAVYSHGKYYPPFLESIAQTGFPKAGAKILLLGLGTGSAVEILCASGKAYSVTAVDIDPVVIKLAKKYLTIPKNWEMEYICAEASSWVVGHTNTFDLVFADVFLHDLTPESMMQTDVLQLLKYLLKPEGVLLFSKLNDSGAAKENVKSFEVQFEAVFTGYTCVDTDGNRVFIWKKPV